MYFQLFTHWYHRKGGERQSVNYSHLLPSLIMNGSRILVILPGPQRGMGKKAWCCLLPLAVLSLLLLGGSEISVDEISHPILPWLENWSTSLFSPATLEVATTTWQGNQHTACFCWTKRWTGMLTSHFATVKPVEVGVNFFHFVWLKLGRY